MSAAETTTAVAPSSAAPAPSAINFSSLRDPPSLRAREDKVWDVLYHPHTHDQHERGLNNNNPRWKIPAKARTEVTKTLAEHQRGIPRGGFAEFYAPPPPPAPAPAADGSGAGGLSPPRKLPPMHPGGDRKHFAPQNCVEQPWHPSFKRAVIDIFPARPTGKRAMTPPNEHNKTELTDIPRGKRRVEEGSNRDELLTLPMFSGVKSVRDRLTGQRVQDKLCENNMDEQARRRGLKKPSHQPSERRLDAARFTNEVEFRREYAARMAASLVNRDATNRATRENTAAVETLSKHRVAVRTVILDRAKSYDIDCVRNLPAFVPDDD